MFQMFLRDRVSACCSWGHKLSADSGAVGCELGLNLAAQQTYERRSGRRLQCVDRALGVGHEDQGFSRRQRHDRVANDVRVGIAALCPLVWM